MGSRRVIVALPAAGVAAAAAACALALPSFAAAPARSKVFDRTVVCTTRIGWIRVGGGPRGRSDSHLGTLSVGDTSGGSMPFAGVQAAPRSDDPTLRGAFLDAEHCAATANKVPLTRKGLSAPVAFGADAVCPVGTRVLVRLRYEYVPGAHHPYFRVGGRFISAALAVRSYRTLKPIAFAALTGGARTFQFSVASSCRT